MGIFDFFGDSIESIDKQIKVHQDAITSLNDRKTTLLTPSTSEPSSFSVFSPGTWFGTSPTSTSTGQTNQIGGGKKKKKKAKTKKNVVRQQQQQMITFTSGYTVGGGKKKKRRVKTIKKRKQ